jgi:type II secretory pathway pseudopilin PulG
MLITIGIICTISAAAIIVMPSFITNSRADSSVTAALNVIRLARDRAISERRNMELSFVSPNKIQIVREEIPGPSTTVLSATFLENEQTFLQFTGLPDTPDAFGNNGPIAFGLTPKIIFTSEGTLVDSVGDVLNGTIFLGVSGKKLSARAVTVFGPTALLRVWKWDGSKWTEG